MIAGGYELESLPIPRGHSIIDRVLTMQRVGKGWCFYYTGGGEVTAQGMPFVCGRLAYALWGRGTTSRRDPVFVRHIETGGGTIACIRSGHGWDFRALDYVRGQKYPVQRPVRGNEYGPLAQELAGMLSRRRQ